MSLGKMNWANLTAYQVQPSDLDLFQTYMTSRGDAIRMATRTSGIVAGGVLSVVAGLQISISAGLAVMPDGTLVQFPALTATLSAANGANPRIDRIELSYSANPNTSVLDTNSQSKVLDFLYTGALNVVVGTAALSPAVPAATGTNISLGLVNVPASAVALIAGNLSQVVDAGLVISAMQSGVGLIRYNRSTGMWQFCNDGARWQAFGSGGGGGGGANWYAAAGTGAPTDGTDNGEKIWSFDATDKGLGVQQLELFQKVPSSYLPGSPITMLLGHYSASTTGTILLAARATLIRKGVDAMSSTANQYTSTNAALVNTVSKQYREAVLDLSTTAGVINGVAISPGDVLKVELFRGTDTDTGDLCFMPSVTETKFS